MSPSTFPVTISSLRAWYDYLLRFPERGLTVGKHAGHLAYTVLESMRENPFFRAPISKTATHIIDVGTGSGGWANDVADMFPQGTSTANFSPLHLAH